MNVKIATMKKPNECRDRLRKRKQFQVEDLDAGSLRLCTNSCNAAPVVFKKPKKSTYDCALDMRIKKRMGWFSFYTRQDEEEERFLGVSTKLTLAINGNHSPTDPWKIKKTLEQSDCDHLCRLMLGKDMVHKYIIKIWEGAGNMEDEIAKLLNHQGGGVAVKVWDYERGKEYELKFKKLISSKCYILSGAWSNKFVKERRLKKGDTIGLYWNTSKSRFVFSVRARAPAPAPTAAVV